ncbi:hypothetical protein B5M44_03950 [Shinella sumterensis]|nr:hypothetical protein B5M44_03950 [Shinella sumterensis]
MRWFKRKTYPYEVVVHLDGRHPYLDGHELDTETRDVTLTVPAKDWNDAAERALEASLPLRAWSYSVTSVRRTRT